MKELDKIISYKYLIDKMDKNDKLEEIIIKSTEYINNYYNIDESKKLINNVGDDKYLFELYQSKVIKALCSHFFPYDLNFSK